VRVRRESALLAEIQRRRASTGTRVGHAVEKTWRTRGEAEALEIIQHVAEEESQCICVGWLDAKRKRWAARAPRAAQLLERANSWCWPSPVMGRSVPTCRARTVWAARAIESSIRSGASRRTATQHQRRSDRALILVVLSALLSYFLA